MTKVLEDAIAQIADLPDAVQDQIGHELLAHVRKLRELRIDIDKGLQSLDTEGGRTLDIEEVIAKARERNARR